MNAQRHVFIWRDPYNFIVLQIVDSIMALFRVDYCGRGELADRQQKLAQMLSRLQKIAEGRIKLPQFSENFNAHIAFVRCIYLFLFVSIFVLLL